MTSGCLHLATCPLVRRVFVRGILAAAIVLLVTAFAFLRLQQPQQMALPPANWKPQARSLIPADNQTHTTSSRLLINDFRQLWSPVHDRKALLYSAFYDDRFDAPLVRILAWIECEPIVKYFCHLIVDRQTRIVVEAELEGMDGPCNIQIMGQFIICRMPAEHAREKPLAVQIFGEKNVPNELLRETYMVPLQYCMNSSLRGLLDATKGNGTYQHELAICINRLYDYVDWIQLILFIEHYRRLGATLFQTYHRSWSQDVHRVIRYYQEQGILRVMSHPPLPRLLYGSIDPLVPQHGTFHQIILLNDCIYSMMGVARFVTVIDTDEFVQPAGSSETIVQMIKRLDPDGDTIAMILRNVYVTSEFPKSEAISLYEAAKEQKTTEIRQHLRRHFLNESICTSQPYENNYRSKTLLRPVAIVKGNPHTFHEHVPGFGRQLQVSTADAVLVHLLQEGSAHIRFQSNNATSKSPGEKCDIFRDNKTGKYSESPFLNARDKWLKRFEGIVSAIGSDWKEPLYGYKSKYDVDHSK